MKLNDLKPVGQLAENYGVKAIIYGKPGTGKTPFLLTGGNTICNLFTEPGVLSLRGHAQPYGIIRNTRAEINDFFDWWLTSAETRHFTGLAVDSVSHWAEIELRYQQQNNRDGRKAYGAMSEALYDRLEKLYRQPGKHIFMIAKLEMSDSEFGPVARPYFPGKDLHIKVPHLFDEVLMLDYFEIPGFGRQRALRCWPSHGTVCRDRSGKLNEYEPADMQLLINKCLA